MLVVRRDIVDAYIRKRPGRKGMDLARRQFDVWCAEVGAAKWRTPADIKARYVTASILKKGRVVFNIKGNDFRLIVLINYAAQVVEIRFLGTHAEYDRIDAETV